MVENVEFHKTIDKCEILSSRPLRSTLVVITHQVIVALHRSLDLSACFQIISCCSRCSKTRSQAKCILVFKDIARSQTMKVLQLCPMIQRYPIRWTRLWAYRSEACLTFVSSVADCCMSVALRGCFWMAEEELCLNVAECVMIQIVARGSVAGRRCRRIVRERSARLGRLASPLSAIAMSLRRYVDCTFFFESTARGQQLRRGSTGCCFEVSSLLIISSL